ncbi:MAG TPA: ATP-binding protein [Steroidobacteraceae bacterium]|nr:ATP-binding protein [Steroidobacteraceae bacterium]
MHVTDELKPGRDFIIALAVCALAGAAIFSAPGPGFPVLHTILNTGIALVTVLLALLFWDLGWRTGTPQVQFLTILFGVAGVLEILHVLAALEPASALPSLNQVMRGLRSGTWAPPAYLLPLGVTALLLLEPTARTSKLAFGVVACAVAAGLFALFQALPRYSAPVVFGIIRPSLAFVPLLWIPAAVLWWRRRGTDRLADALAWYAIGTALAHSLMLYSDEATSKFAMAAHFGVFGCSLYLLLSLVQMGTLDTSRRMRAELALRAMNETLEARVADRTKALESLNDDLRQEAGVRQQAESRALVQLARLELLRRITHAIAERQDLDSIFQVVVRSVEEHMPADFAAMCNYENHGGTLTVSRVGVRSAPLALELAMTESARIEIDQNGLSRCVAGQLVYEPDITGIPFPFPQRLAGAGLRCMVIVPLIVEQRSGVFGVLIVARRDADAFSSGECEFLRQLCDHVSLAANQAQLHESLKQAYEDLRLTQDAVMEQERLRALGQMSSGIAHDINNAISPVSLYVEALLNHEKGVSDRGRKQLEVIQRAIDDVAQTVKRMGDFYRLKPQQLELTAIEVEPVLREVLDLTRARWSDMAQQRGIVIDARIETAAERTVAMAIESELREALVNLVLNATDAMPDGGTLTLRTGHTLEAGKGVARRVFIEVSDTGLGMDEETRRRCLEPFFTTKGARGSGLGLAMVYGIAQRLGMDIEIQSSPGSGTTFRLVFALSEPAPQSTGSLRIQKIPTHTKILVIDDDPVLLMSLREVLVHDGHQVQTANGGRAGIEAFLDAQKAGKPFPIVITDLGMPHVDGRAVAAAVKTAAPGTAILLLTGWGQRLMGTGEVPAEVDAVLSKPPRIAELRQKIADITTAGE